MGAALVADTLDESVLSVVDLFVFKWCVVEQHLDRIRALVLQTAHRPVVEQIGHAASFRRIVSGLFVSQQQAFAVAMLARR